MIQRWAINSVTQEILLLAEYPLRGKSPAQSRGKSLIKRHYLFLINVGPVIIDWLTVGLVPARYVRQSQMCPQLDMSDKNDQKTQDMSDKARCVRQKSQDMSDRCVRQKWKKNARYVWRDTSTTSKRLEWLLNLLIPIIHPFYSTHNTIHLEFVPYMTLTKCYLIKANVHACAWCMRMGVICVFQENANETQTIYCRTYPAVFWHFCRTHLALSDISSRNRPYGNRINWTLGFCDHFWFFCQ